MELPEGACSALLTGGNRRHAGAQYGVFARRWQIQRRSQSSRGSTLHQPLGRDPTIFKNLPDSQKFTVITVQTHPPCGGGFGNLDRLTLLQIIGRILTHIHHRPVRQGIFNRQQQIIQLLKPAVRQMLQFRQANGMFKLKRP
mgnify:CR=1 FL=1